MSSSSCARWWPAASRSTKVPPEQREKEELNLPLIDEKAWKFVREREKLRAYISRTKDSKEMSWTSSVSSGSNRKSVTSTTAPQQPALDHLSVMLVVGTVAGKMEDMMYGTMNHTVDASRIKTSCVEDTKSGVAMLTTLAAPTLEDPFRSFTIKYAAIKQVPVVRTVVKKRDYVFMEITGIVSLPNDGERIGYHSVHFP